MKIYNSRFDLAAVGKFITAEKRKAWPGLNISFDDDPSGDVMSILHDGGPNNEACCRYVYPPGHVGAPGRSYQMSLGPVRDDVTLSLDFMFEDHTTADNGKDFDFYGNGLQSHNGGKVPGALQCGPIAGARGGVRAMTWWGTNSTNNSPAHPKDYNCVLQWQQTIPAPPNNELIQPVKHWGSTVPGVWNHVEHRVRPGVGGYLRSKFNGGSPLIYAGSMGGSLITDSVILDMVGFSGGGSASADSPLWPGWVRVANVQLKVGL